VIAARDRLTTCFEMRFLVDTDVVSYAMSRNERVLRRWVDYRRQDIGISAIVEAELRFGAVRYPGSRIATNLDRFLQPYEIVEFSTAHVPAYAKLRATLEHRGHLIGTMDMLIAAQALALDLILVTNNEKEFRRVPGLKIENWAA
jgi:tRNA(fMet)-specific endonuclease VapC